MNLGNEIEINGVEKSYGFNIALKGIDFHIKKGEFLTLFGPNGAGKSTLLSILSTILKPTKGSAKISGLDINKNKSEIRHKIGLIGHSHMLYENLSAVENLHYFGTFYDIENLKEKSKQLLNNLGLYKRRTDLVKTYSSGMKQRLSVARALLHDPEILLLDEPYNGLDQSGIKLFTEIISSFKDKGYTTILTTHNIEEGLELCSRTAILSKGNLVHDSYDTYDTDSFRSLYQSSISN